MLFFLNTSLCCDIDDTLNLIIAIVDKIDIIVLQIKILIAIYGTTSEALLFVVNHATSVLIGKFYTHSNTINLLSFYLIMNSMDDIKLVITITNTIIAIIVEIVRFHTILIVIAIINAILFGKLDRKENASRIIGLY